MTKPTLTLFAALLFATPLAARAEDRNAAVEKEILDLVRKEWDAEMKQDADAMIKARSKGYTIFDLGNPYRTDAEIDNAMTRLTVKSASKVVYESLVNPRVQVYGDVAVLSYNFVGLTRGADGKISRDFNRATRVYAKEGGQWLLVHGHFSRPIMEP